MAPTRAETQANYDRLSRWYDWLAGKSESRLRDIGLSRLGVRPGEVILELGSGTGHALAALGAAAGPSGFALGLDLSPGMCRMALRTLRRQTGSAQICCGDAARLPLADHSMDAAFMSFALELFDADDAAVVLAECDRVLRVGGRLCVVAMVEPRRPSLMSRLYVWFHRRFPKLVDCRPIPVSQVLEAHGFHVTGATEHMLWGLPVAVVTAQVTQPTV